MDMCFSYDSYLLLLLALYFLRSLVKLVILFLWSCHFDLQFSRKTCLLRSTMFSLLRNFCYCPIGHFLLHVLILFFLCFVSLFLLFLFPWISLPCSLSPNFNSTALVLFSAFFFKIVFSTKSCFLFLLFLSFRFIGHCDCHLLLLIARFIYKESLFLSKMDRNARRRKQYAEMSSDAKDALLLCR